MTVRAFCILVFMNALLALTHECAYSQPFPPPQGWEYVRSFDSVDVFGTHAKGDTIIVTGENLWTQTDYIYSSTDGGTTWDSARMPGGLYGPSGFFPKSNEMWFWGLDGKVVFITTSDMGKTYTRSHLDSATNRAFGPFINTMQINPFDPEDFILTTSSGSGSDLYCAAYRSRDGGQTWAQISSGPFSISVLFDVRQAGLWYVNANGVTYRTNDNGSTIVPIGSAWGSYCGITAPGVFRIWWDTISTLDVVGIKDKKAEPDPTDTVIAMNWLAKMDTLPADLNYNTGHYHGLGVAFYSFFESAPENAVITNIFDHWNPQTDSTYRDVSYIYRTKDNGKSWELLWGNEHSAGFTAVDENTRRVWALSQDVIQTVYGQFVPRNFSLWRYDLSTNVIDQGPINITNHVTILAGFPSPVKDRLSLQFEIRHPGRIVIRIADITGRSVQTLLDERKDFGEQTFEFEISKKLISGTYWVQLESAGQISELPILIVK